MTKLYQKPFLKVNKLSNYSQPKVPTNIAKITLCEK